MAHPSPPSTDGKESLNPLPTFEQMDAMTHEQLAEALAQLAETIITNPLEYKLSYGLETLDPKLLDAVDVSTPEGRRKLAALLKMLARLAMGSKTQYLAAVKDPAQDKSRSR
jgi:hypothetical protein